MRERSQQILDLAKSRILRPRDFADLKVSRRVLADLVASGDLLRTARGLYVASDFDLTQNHSLAEALKRWPSSVVCLLSALQFHELTLELPAEVWLSFKRGGSLPKSKDIQTRVVQMSDEAFMAGIETHVIEGVNVRIYSVAKTIADCFKFRSQVGTQVAYHALKEAWTKRKASADDLVHHAKLCRVYNVMRPYLETLTA